MDLSTLIIEEGLRTFLATAYSSLLREYTFFTIAMAVSFVIFPIFAVWMLNRRDRNSIREGKPYKAYTQRDQAKHGVHIAVYLLMPVFAAMTLYLDVQRVEAVNVYGWELVALDVLLLLLSAAAAWKLFKWRVSGLFMTGAFVFFYTVCQQYQRLLIVKADMSLHAKFTPVEEYTVYIVNDYNLTYAMAVSLLAVSIITALAVYYYRRRFLFLPGKLNLPTCENCGQMISPGDVFCTCCGKPLENRSAVHVIESLDKKLYCGTCGRFTNGIICLACNKENGEELKKVAQGHVSEKEASLIRNVVLVICMVVLLLLNMAGSVKDIQSGSAKANNAFVERWEELKDNPEKASDPEWLAGFDSAAKALYAVDSRWYYVKPRSVKANELIYFHVYANASFRQMKAIEQIQQEVHNAAEGRTSEEDSRREFTDLGNYFNQTIVEQSDALRYKALFAQQYDLLGKFGYICLDGLHAFLPMVNIVWVAIAVLTVCTVMWIVMMNGFASDAGMKWEQKIQNCWRSVLRIANEVRILFVELAGMAAAFASLFRPRNIGRCAHWLKAGLTAPKNSRADISESYKRVQRKSTILAAVIAAAFFAAGLGPSLMNGGALKPSDKQAYLNAAKAAAVDYAVDISQMISDIGTTGTFTEEQKARLYALIDLQIEADQTLLKYDISQLDDYQEMHAGLCGLCKDDMDTLQRLRAVIEEGSIPSKELQKNYASLRGERYLWTIQELMAEFAGLEAETIMDF